MVHTRVEHAREDVFVRPLSALVRHVIRDPLNLRQSRHRRPEVLEIWIQQRANHFFQPFIDDNGNLLSTGILQ